MGSCKHTCISDCALHCYQWWNSVLGGAFLLWSFNWTKSVDLFINHASKSKLYVIPALHRDASLQKIKWFRYSKTKLQGLKSHPWDNSIARLMSPITY